MNILEKFFYISLGLTVDLGKKLGETLDSLVKESKISELDAKKIKQEFEQTTQRYSRDIRSKFDEFIRKTLESKKFVQHSDLQDIEKRINELEKKIEQKN